MYILNVYIESSKTHGHWTGETTAMGQERQGDKNKQTLRVLHFIFSRMRILLLLYSNKFPLIY